MTKRTLLCLCAAASPVTALAADLAPSVVDRMEASTVRVLAHHKDESVSTGTGIVFYDGKAVATNLHVVRDADEILILGKNLKIEVDRVLAHSPEKDLVVLGLPQTSNRPAATLVLRSGVAKTQTIYAAGFPGAADRRGIQDPNFLEVKITQGIVSAFVTSETGTLMYQVSAAINPGNSGGPLFDECGRVVGVNAEKSLKPAVVIGDDGKPTVERVPFGEGVGWAIQAGELLGVLQQAGVNPSVESSPCGAQKASEKSTSPPDQGQPETASPAKPLLNPTNLLLGGLGVAVLSLCIVVLVRTSTRPERIPPPPVSIIDVPPPAPKARLKGVIGIHQAQEFPLSEKTLTLGRDPRACQIVFPNDDKQISGRHCAIRLDAATRGVVLEDCGSTNGTFLDNGERLKAGERKVVPPNGRFYLGDRSHLFEVQ